MNDQWRKTVKWKSACRPRITIERCSADILVKTWIGVPTSTLGGPIATAAAYVAYSCKEHHNFVPKLRVLVCVKSLRFTHTKV